MSEKFSRIRSVILREEVVEQIRLAIIEGRLKPNDHIIEQTLTEQLGVSRTPIREALILLEREGLIVSYPNRGSFVREFTENDVDAIFSMRTALENFAAELIIERLTDTDFEYLDNSIEIQAMYIRQRDFKQVRTTDMAFHQYLIDRTNHPILIKNWGEIVAQIAALLYIRAEAMPDYDEDLAVADHQSIVEAFKNRKAEQVARENRRINNRVAGECANAVVALARTSNL